MSLRCTMRRKEGEPWRTRDGTTVCFAESSSKQMRATRVTRSTAPKRIVGRPVRRRVVAPGSPNRRTGTTFADRRMSRGCRLGGRNTRATGDARHGQAVRDHSQRLRYKRSAGNSSITPGGRACAWVGAGRLRSPAEHAPEVTVEGIDPDGFDGQQGLVVDIELAATGGLSEAEPVGRLVSRAAKA